MSIALERMETHLAMTLSTLKPLRASEYYLSKLVFLIFSFI